jgi:serine/threonine protein kinase
MRKSYCGTPLYLSPEMVRKQYYGKSVDVWAVGLVVYELLVGRVPFSVWNQEDMSEILTKPVHFPEYIDRTKRCE